MPRSFSEVHNPNFPAHAPNFTPSKPLREHMVHHEFRIRDLQLILAEYPDTVERSLINGDKAYFSRLALPDCRCVEIVVNPNLGTDGICLYPYTGVKAFRVYGDVQGTPLPELLRKLECGAGNEALFAALGRVAVDRGAQAP